VNAENHEFHRLGHTHGGGKALILENLQVLTGEAEYGRPEIQQTENEVAAQPPPRICKTKPS
jgi:hypothetical protein